MAADTSVKYFNSSQAGAPTLNGTAGSLIAILDACLVDGFGLKSVDSIVVSSGVATMTISSGHSFIVDSVALVSGATPAELNGEKKVISVSSSTVTFAATGVANQTATGTITTKLAPAGWSKAFSTTNIAAYRSVVGSSLGMYLRVDDTGTLDARVSGYEVMTDVNTGTGNFPTSTQMAGGLYWGKANAADATARNWVVVADKASVFFWSGCHTTYKASHGLSHFFGDTLPYLAGDSYHTTILGNVVSSVALVSSSTGAMHGDVANGAGTTTGVKGHYIARAHSQTGGSLAVSKTFSRILEGSTAAAIGAVDVLLSGAAVALSANLFNTGAIQWYPNPIDGGLAMCPLNIVHDGGIRADLPGVMATPAKLNGNIQNMDIVDGSGYLQGRRFLSVRCAPPGVTFSNTVGGTIFVDITGPWR